MHRRYDVIVAGGGAAGAVVARRLSEVDATEVLLLEAGPDLRPRTTPPALRSLNAFRAMDGDGSDAYLWPSLIARRSARQAPAPYLRGRGLGGSSAINGMIAAQPFPEDFDAWARLGCQGWSWDDVLGFRTALEDDLDFGERPHHGSGGPVPISRPAPERWGAMGVALRDAAIGLGYPWEEDLNDPLGTGVSPLAHTCRDGRRVSIADAYLEPVRERPNLTIICDTVVDRVLIDDGAAVGVCALDRRGERVRYWGDRVVVCGGAIGTPGILVRSGIGPQERLAALEIATEADLPVGTSYRDHCGVGFTVALKQQHQVADLDAQSMSCALRYSSGLAGGGRNDMNIFALNFSGGSRAAASAGFVKVSVYEAFSDGEVRVVSADPLAQPQIEMNLLADERDRIRLRDGVRRLIELLRTPAFGLIADGIHTAGDTVFDHASESPFALDDADDDDKLDAWLRQAVTDTAHGVGTCPIGRVVDDECRVYGIDGLWVADASVMPAVPRVNTMLPTLIVAERVASCMRQRGAETLQAVT